MSGRILFINGPSQDLRCSYHAWPTSLLYAIGPTIQAMRVGDLKFSFEDDLFDPGIWVSPEDDEAIFNAFDERLTSADVLCASATYDSLRPVLRLFRRAKERQPDTVTILGGPHVDETHQLPRFNDAEIHRHLIDFSISGDADLALLELLRALTAKQSTLISSRINATEGFFNTYCRGNLVARGNQPLRLDSLPPPPVELADTPARRHNLGRLLGRPDLSPCVETIAQRGCVYACECCSERRIPLNQRSVGSIVAEVELRKHQGFRFVFFNDSTFGLYRPIRELLAELQHTGMKFGCLNRFDLLVDPSLLNSYKDAGFVYFYCAVEQFDDSVLRGMAKAESTERMENAMCLLRERDLMVGVSLLYGLPEESSGSIARTLDFVGEWVDAGVIRLASQSILSLHPGTPMGMRFEGTFDCVPPHRGFPFDQFEEGQWYHAPHVTARYLEWIASESQRCFGNVLVRRLPETLRQQSSAKSTGN